MELREARQRQSLMRARRAEFERDVALAKKILGRAICAAPNNYACGIYLSAPYGVHVSVKLDVESMTDKRLTDALERAIEFGLVIDNHDVANRWQGARVFTIRLPNGGKLELTAEIPEESEGTCRKVKTGVKLVEEPQYQLICN